MISSGGLLHSQNPTTVDRYSCSGRDLMPRTRSGRSWFPGSTGREVDPICAARTEGCCASMYLAETGDATTSMQFNRSYASSSCAYRSMNFFVPRPGKLTDTRRSSSSPSTPTTVPVPYVGCRTFRPSIGLESAPRFNGGRVNEPGLLCRRCEDDTGFIPLRTRCKNSSDEYEYSGSSS